MVVCVMELSFVFQADGVVVGAFVMPHGN